MNFSIDFIFFMCYYKRATKPGLLEKRLTHMPFTHAFTGSNPVQVTILWRFSSVGRASALQAEGQRFEPVNLHHYAGLAQLVEQLTCNQ